MSDARSSALLRSDSIIFASPSLDTFVFDIPVSIAQAQHSQPFSKYDNLLSCTPLQHPYADQEPRSAEKRAAILARSDPADGKRNFEYRDLIHDALRLLRDEGGVDVFCHPRHVVPSVSSEGRKRKRVVEGVEEDVTEDEQQKNARNVDVLLRRLARQGDVKFTSGYNRNEASSPEAANLDSNSNFFYNPELHPLVLTSYLDVTKLNFSIPPGAAALNANLQSTPDSLMALATLCKTGDARFDLILLDPPWPNRSARRKQAYQAYDYDVHAGSLTELEDLLLNLSLEEHMATEAYVAIWVTNKPSVRATVTRLFNEWNVRLEEEWIWAKVTVSGEPVTDLDGVWKQPWEVLMIGRKRPVDSDAGKDAQEAHVEDERIVRRVICAVPDLHSRKPCLKELFDRLLFGKDTTDPITLATVSSTPRVLELFARYLVSGWMSWGNEALKYQWDGWWTR